MIDPLASADYKGPGPFVATKSIGFDPAPREVLKRQFEELETTMQNGTCPGHHNAVAISFKAGQSADGGLGVDACAFEPGITKREMKDNRVVSECIPTMRSGMGDNQTAVAIRTANTHANGQEVAFKLDATRSNSMKSANPHSGIHETQVHCALDTTDPNPTKAQGGVVLAVSISTKQQSLATAVEAAPTMGADDYKEPFAIGIGRDAFNSGKNAQMAQSISTEVQPPITAKGPGGVCTNGAPATGRM